MKNIIPYKKDIEFNSKIAEITSISLEHEESVNDNEVNGNFHIFGDYKIHNISVNKEPFNYTLPFSIELSDEIIKDSIKIDINDFTYDIKDNNILEVKIELAFSYDNKEVDDDKSDEKEMEFDREIIELINDNNEKEEELALTPTSDNTYITYHIHIFNEVDDIGKICKDYNISKEELSEYNDLTNLNKGDKILIPILKDE